MRSEWEKKKKHRDMYIAYIRRKLIKDSGPELREDDAAFNLVAIDSQNGLSAPLYLPQTRESTPAINSTKIKEKCADQTLMDIKNRSKSVSTTKCIDNVLTPSDLCHIFASSSKIDFGDLSTHSLKSLSFNIINRSPSKSTVFINIFIKEIGSITSFAVTPTQLVIPYQKTGTFEVSCRHHITGLIETNLSYVINNRYIYQVPIRANVTYIPLNLSSYSLHFDVSKCSYDDSPNKATGFIKEVIKQIEYQFPVIEKMFEISNADGHEVFFEIIQEKCHKMSLLQHGVCDGILELYPPSGIIGAGKNVSIIATYIPGTRTSIEKIIDIHIYDLNRGQRKQIQTLNLKCFAEGIVSQCTIINHTSRNALDLGVVPIYSSVHGNINKLYDLSLTEFSKMYTGRTSILGRKVIKVKNSGHAKYLYVASLLGNENVARIENPYGFIPVNGTADIIVYGTPGFEGFFEDHVIINIIGGGKSFKIPLKYEASKPLCEIKMEDSLESDVIMGGSSNQIHVIKNTGAVFNRLVVSMERDFKFGLIKFSDDSILSTRPNSSRSRNSLATTIKLTKLPDANLRLGKIKNGLTNTEKLCTINMI